MSSIKWTIRGSHITLTAVGASTAWFLLSRNDKTLNSWGKSSPLPRSVFCDAIDASSTTNGRKSSILFLGSGSSTGTPHPYFIMKPSEHFRHHNKELLGPHLVSMKAAEGNPADNKNYRCNPSILIRYRGGDFTGEKNILIDCGKTFRESVIRWFPRHKVSSVDAVLLSHGHADAIFGLDDIRGLQDRKVVAPMPIYLSPDCMHAIRRVLFYLVPDPAKAAVPGADRAISALSWLEVPPNEPLDVLGLEVTPFNVMHGEDMTSFGFVFGEKERVCYISDISRMLPESLALIKQRPVDILVVDALLKEGKYFSHYNLEEAIALIREIRPRRALLTGMSSQFDHEATNAELRKYLQEEGLDIQLSHDGMNIDIDL